MPLPSKDAIAHPDPRAAELAERGRRFGLTESLGPIPKRDPGWKRPSRRRVLAIRDRLRRMYGRPVNEPHGHPIAELVRTILSQNNEADSGARAAAVAISPGSRDSRAHALGALASPAATPARSTAGRIASAARNHATITRASHGAISV